MIVVTIDLWPHGEEKRQKRLGRMFIWNTGTGDKKRGNYEVGVRRRGRETLAVNEHPSANCTRLGLVNNYPRLSYNIWRLVIRALKSAFKEEA